MQSPNQWTLHHTSNLLYLFALRSTKRKGPKVPAFLVNWCAVSMNYAWLAQQWTCLLWWCYSQTWRRGGCTQEGIRQKVCACGVCSSSFCPVLCLDSYRINDLPCYLHLKHLFVNDSRPFFSLFQLKWKYMGIHRIFCCKHELYYLILLDIRWPTDWVSKATQSGFWLHPLVYRSSLAPTKQKSQACRRELVLMLQMCLYWNSK